MRQWKIVSFNVNSVRVRLEDLLAWMGKENPDVVCLQETKVQDPDFPAAAFTDTGYHAAFLGEKSKNGVAILSREKPAEIKTGLDEWGQPGEARLIAARFDQIAVVNTYVPQGQDPQIEYFQYKLGWLRHMRDYFSRHYTPSEPVIWLGDLNVAPESIDIYDPKRLLGRVGYHPDEHAAFAYTKEWGFTDVFRKHVPEGGHYTFWDYRVMNALDRGLGWRIDHILATENLAARSTDAWVDTSLRRLAKPSDHAPIIATFELA